MRWHKLHMQARTVGFARLPRRRRRELRFERQPRAVRCLEPARDRSTSPFDRADRPRDAHRVAVRGVEREAWAVDVFVDVLDLQRDAVDDRRERVRGSRSPALFANRYRSLP